MGAEQQFDSRIKTALAKECGGISASDELKRRIDETIRERQEDNSMKHMSVKKLCISVAAACLLVSGVTAFAGGAAYFVTGSAVEPECTDYTQLGRLEKELGYEVDSVERFGNGYAFTGMSVETIEAYTGENGRLYSVPAMNIRYRRGDKQLELNINEKTAGAAPSKEPDATRLCGDISLRCDMYTNKIVPDSYELTEEDKRNEQRDDYNIVYTTVTVKEKEAVADGENPDDVKYGSYTVSDDGAVSLRYRGVPDDGAEDAIVLAGCDDAVIRQTMMVSWEKDGIAYELSGIDPDMSAEEMLDMAEEIVAAK